MFQPFRLRGLELPNRVVVSPMDMYRARDGVPSEFHLVHLGGKALGGAGLMMTEMVCISADGRITPGCAGLYSPEQEAGWRRIVDFVHGESAAKIGVQLGHSGRKGSTRVMWEGIDQPLAEGNWEVCAPSPIPYRAGVNQVPRELGPAELAEITEQFVAATRAALRAGFDLVELHCAHGYLLSSFLSPVTNRRTDRYGGSLANRLRYPLEVFRAMRAVWPASPYADAIRNQVGIATIAVGAISSYDDVNSIILAGRADLCALGRAHLYDPNWTLHAAAEQGYQCPSVRWPDPWRAGSRKPNTGRVDGPKPRLELIRRS